MEQRLNEARGEHAKAGEFVIQDSVNRNGTKIKWGSEWNMLKLVSL